ncbi:MAG TPA: hypothetical protein VKT52_05655 [Ktedonobacterales bacterium]|nr:hypothetical protein [Ktedonobacterales bacterium]
MGRITNALTAGARVVLAGIFGIIVRVFYAVEIHGLEHDARAPHTYYVLSHKRDIDPIILVPPLLRHRGWRALAGGVRFAMRADAFSPGFLARLLGPTPLAWALRPLALGGIVRGLGALPIESLQRPTEEWLRDTLRLDGDGPAGDALSPRALEQLAAASGERASAVAAKPLSALFAWRYLAELRTLRGPDMLAGARRHNARRHVLAAVRAQLGALSAALRTYGSLLGAPEGGLSPDGRVRPIAGGLHRILRDAPADTRVQPVVIVYDFMRTGRPRVFIDLAPPLPDAVTLPGRLLHAELRRTWLAAMRFTCTQLATGYLVWAAETSHGEFTLAEMAVAVRRLALALATAGRHVDAALLSHRAAHRAVARYLAYAQRHGLVRHAKHGRWLAIPRDLTIQPQTQLGQAAYASQPLAYAWNELLDLLGTGRWAASHENSASHTAVGDDWLQWIQQQRVPIALHAR